MKTLKLNKTIVFLFTLLVFTCVEDDDFNVPNTSITASEIPSNNIVSISSVAGKLAQAMNSGNSTFTFQFDNNSNYMQGFIVSTDEAGNFFHELIIQDTSETPIHRIRLRIYDISIFSRYKFLCSIPASDYTVTMS